jgi:hypothetical protein
LHSMATLNTFTLSTATSTPTTVKKRTYFFVSTATVVTRTHHNVPLYVHCSSCWNIRRPYRGSGGQSPAWHRGDPGSILGHSYVRQNAGTNFSASTLIFPCRLSFRYCPHTLPLSPLATLCNRSYCSSSNLSLPRTPEDGEST